MAETNVNVPEDVEKPTITMAKSNIVYYLALGLGFSLNAFLSWYLMHNLPSINFPSPMPFLFKLIKNNKESQGNDMKLCMLTRQVQITILNSKKMMFNFTLVSNNNTAWSKRSAWFQGLLQQGPQI